jgi:hypothetical protein
VSAEQLTREEVVAFLSGWLAVVLLALAACSLAFSAGPRRGLAIAGRQRAFLVSPAAPLSDHFFGLLDVLSIAVAIVVSRVRGAVGGRVAALIVAGFLPGLGSLLVAVLVWPLAIASWKRQVRRA